MIHIIGAPRTGSTLMLQVIVNHFHVTYFGNDGKVHKADEPVPYESWYGKTKKPHEPSEASPILSSWFGENKQVKPDMKERVKSIVKAADRGGR